MAISTTTISSPVSTLLYNADGTQRTPYYLVKISLPAYSPNPADTLYLSTPAYTGPDGVRWDDAILELGQINAGGSWLTPKWNPADVDIVVSDKRITGQAVAETFHDLFPDYEFVGADVHVMIAFENTTSVSDYATIFYGKVVDWGEMDSRSVTLYCSQARDWSQIIPPNTITATDYPYAPTAVIGSRRQIVLGDWTLSRTIPTVATGTETLIAGVARAMLPLPIIEQETAAGGLESPKGMVSDRDMHTDPSRIAVWENGVNAWAYSVTAPTITGSGPVYAQVAGDYQFYLPIFAIEDNGSTALNWQEAVRRDKPTTLEGKVSFDATASQSILDLYLPEVQEIGSFIGAYVDVWYNKNAGGASLPRFGLKNAVTVDGLQDLPTAATSSTSASVPYGYARVNVGPTATGGSNTVQGWDSIKTSRIYADVRTAGQTMEIHRILLTVLYRPAARLVTPGTTRDTKAKNISVTGRKVDNPVEGQTTYRHSYGAETSPDAMTYDAPMFGFGKGVPDSGHATALAGHYTGTAGALIEHPVDLVHWMLREIGGDSNVTTTAGEFGSFADAKTDLASYKFRAVLAEESNVEEIIEQIGQESLTWYFKRTTVEGAPWVAIPWLTSASQDYREASDLVDFNRAGPFIVRDSLQVGRTPLSGVANAIRVNYDYDLRTRTYGDQLYITPDGSRVYSGGAFTTDGSRVTTATTSETRFGRRDLTLNLKWVADPATASSILTRTFDWRANPRVRVRFATFLNALDLERGHIIRLGSDWDDYLTYPKPGANGSWASKNLQVYAVRKLTQLPVQYEVLAVET